MGCQNQLPIQYQSCFISDSSRDEEFARRLHEKLRGEKLWVWFAPEDMQGGRNSSSKSTGPSRSTTACCWCSRSTARPRVLLSRFRLRPLDSIGMARHFIFPFHPESLRETPVMSIEHFESLIELLSDRRPFHPFTIELENGQRFEVDHPRAMATHNGMAFCWAPGGVPLWFDHQSVTSIVGDTANTSV